MDFNSIKVRLEHSLQDGVDVYLVVFQFHKGTIRTHCGVTYNVVNAISIP